MDYHLWRDPKYGTGCGDVWLVRPDGKVTPHALIMAQEVIANATGDDLMFIRTCWRARFDCYCDL